MAFYYGPRNVETYNKIVTNLGPVLCFRRYSLKKLAVSMSRLDAR